MPVPFVSGWVRLTASGIVGVSGAPIWISGYSVDNTGGGAAIPYFLSGTTTSGAVAFRGFSGAAAAGIGLIQDTGVLPIVFPTGLFVSFDANTSAVNVFYVQA